MEINKLDRTIRLIQPPQDRLGTPQTSEFYGLKVMNVMCVACDKASFNTVLANLVRLRFEVAYTSSLGSAFQDISTDPSDFGLVVIRMDCTMTDQRLESYVRLLRMLDIRIPILMIGDTARSENTWKHPTIYADCVTSEPQTIQALIAAVQLAVEADAKWGSRFESLRMKAQNRISRPFEA